MTPFEQLIAEAERQPFSGWDFSYLRGRMREEAPRWDYASLVCERLRAVKSALDMGTGGGEFLAALAPLPPRMVATEAYPPNVEIARARLAPLGVEVVAVAGAPDNLHIVRGEGVGSLPFPDNGFQVVINRHESYYPAEVYRILERGGAFITQQVGGEHYRALNEALGVSHTYGPRWNLTFALEQLTEAGFAITDYGEDRTETVFQDIGAVAYYLKAVPWQVPDYSIAGYRDRFAALHERMEAEGGLRIQGHYFYIVAEKSLD